MPILDFSLARQATHPATTAAVPAFFSTQIAAARRFHLPPASPGRLSLRVISGGIEHCSPDYKIQRNTFPFNGMEFVAGGQGTLVLKGHSHRLVPGTFFTYGPKIAHHITTNPREPLVKYFIDFTGPAAAKLLRETHLAAGSIHQTSAPAEMMSIFDELIRAGHSDSPRTARICAALLEALLLKLADTRVPIGSVETMAFDTYQRCVRELEQHALELQTLKELAGRCELDEAYLCRLFKRFDRESPYRRLMRLKMSHAASRMRSPGILMKQVAAEMGFSDPYHFSRAFKGVFGVSPTQLLRSDPRTGQG